MIIFSVLPTNRAYLLYLQGSRKKVLGIPWADMSDTGVLCSEHSYALHTISQCTMFWFDPVLFCQWLGHTIDLKQTDKLSWWMNWNCSWRWQSGLCLSILFRKGQPFCRTRPANQLLLTKIRRCTVSFPPPPKKKKMGEKGQDWLKI